MISVLLKKLRKIFFITSIIILYLAGCASQNIEMKHDNESFNNDVSSDIPFATQDVIDLYEANLAKEYYIGPGDRIKIEVWRRPELTGEHVVGPYGDITLNLLGEFKLGGKTIKEAVDSIKDLYGRYYDDPVVTIKILEYINNKVYVLGRVSNPGVIHLDGSATLLEAMSIAGGLPAQGKTVPLTKCYIIRGKEQIIWIDLNQLLEKANIRLNIGLANNDIIYIPDSTDASVFVMGEARNPGSYPIQQSGLTILDAINLAGGTTEDANNGNIRLIRGMKEQDGVKTIDLNKMIAQGDLSQNFILKDNDIIYIPRKGIAKFNYYLRQINPFISTFLTAKLIQNGLTN
jgi:polysaccharide biosynthesis/export protein